MTTPQTWVNPTTFPHLDWKRLAHAPDIVFATVPRVSGITLYLWHETSNTHETRNCSSKANAPLRAMQWMQALHVSGKR